MNEVNSFAFYRNYFELIDNLPNKDKDIMLRAIVYYVFKDEEPQLDGMNKAIWSNIVLPLNTSKKNSLKSKGNGAPRNNQNAVKKQTKNKPNSNQIQTKNKPKTNQKQTNNISISLSISFSNLSLNNINNKDKIYKLLEEYLQVRKKNKYTISETIVTRLVNKLNEYGKTDEEKMEIITNAINGAWKDFYPLKQEPNLTPAMSRWEETKRKFLAGEEDD